MSVPAVNGNPIYCRTSLWPWRVPRPVKLKNYTASHRSRVDAISKKAPGRMMMLGNCALRYLGWVGDWVR